LGCRPNAERSRGEGFLGQFGIGLLSCFLVSDEIVVISKSARDLDSPTIEWRGASDGTYAVRSIERDMEPGTQIYLRAKPSGAEWMDIGRIRELCQKYGRYLHHKIELTADGRTESLNDIPLWEHDTNEPAEREHLMNVGQELFDRTFFDVFPLQSQFGQVQGLAFVLGQAAHAGSAQSHRAYLKNMLLSEKTQNLLPDWAFFVQCVVNVKGLRPTASRESFYEDTSFEAAREDLGECLRRYLIDLSRQDPARLRQFISIHDTSIKVLAVDDDECLKVFADWLPFETSAG
jgi:molecular chaperone HtpG